VDIGGGSTELIVGGPDGVASHRSLDVGSVRLTERFGDDVDACADHVRASLPELTVSHAVGVAGTVANLASLDLSLPVHDAPRTDGYRLQLRGVEEQLERLAALPLAERRNVPGLEPERAPVIVAGAVILREVLVRYRVEEIEVSGNDLLDGAALEAAELPAAEEGAAPPGAHTCC